MVEFEYFNLLEEMKYYGEFDIILCRNVINNFDMATRKSVLERLSKQLSKDGFLVLGKGEKSEGITNIYRPIGDYIEKKDM